MEPIITVRELSKSYLIQPGQNKSYKTLRDDFTNLAKNIFQGKRKRSNSTLFWALKDISFDVYPGEIIGILGRNGAGKSTLLKILSRIVKPTSGEIIVRGRCSSLLEIGTGFHPELTGYENIFMSGSILGMKKREIKKKFDEIVEFAEIESYLNMPVKRYSSGMYMRLAFSVAAHLEPEILMVDEVLAVGDSKFQKKCLGKMSEVSQRGRTVLFVSHNIGAIRNLCNKGIVLNQGKLEYSSTIEQAIYNYSNLSNDSSTQNLNGIQLNINKIYSNNIVNPDFYPDSDLTVNLELKTNVIIPHCYLNFIIEDPEGNYIIHSRTDYENLKPSFNQGIHMVSINIPRLGLRPGIYNLWFRLYSNTNELSLTLDSERAFLEVKGESYGGIISTPCNWKWQAVI